MSDPIDYSRPVGWWCPVCGHDEAETDVDVLWNSPDFVVGTDSVTGRREPIHICKVKGTGWCIPRYLPIPEGQRPPAASEVEEAEVVTFTIPGTADPAWCAPPGWTTFKDTAEEIYKIVVGVKSFVTGATE